MPAMKYTAQQVGAALRRARKAAGLTQQAVAKLGGGTKSMISEWETGARDPQTSNLLRLLDLYGISFSRWARLLQKETDEDDDDPAEVLEVLTARVAALESELSRLLPRSSQRLRL